MFPGSDFYGIGKILLAYAGLPKFFPFPVAVQHGWFRFAHKFEASANPPEIWVWSERQKNELKAYYPEERIRVTGSFFNYLLVGNNIPTESSKNFGSICIPPHSSHFVKTRYPIDDFIKLLEELDEKFKPITVMLYYLDMTENTVSAYKNRGFNVVSNGSLFNQDFLLNFIRNVQGKRFCIFSDLGSGVFYAARLGVEPYHINITSTVVNEGNCHVNDEHFNAVTKFDENVLSKFDNKLIAKELGSEHLLSRCQVRKLLVSNYFTYEFLVTFAKWGAVSLLQALRLRKKESLE